MGIGKMVVNLIQELKGGEKEVRDREFSSRNSFENAEEARKEFSRSKKKLFDVNNWSEISELSCGFQLYDEEGEKRRSGPPKEKEYVKITPPVPAPENWVLITDVRDEENNAEFTVSPCTAPNCPPEEKHKIEHFFIDEATSTFRVKLEDKTIYAWEIGKNQTINNEGREAGERKLMNTLMAQGGWAWYQRFQWEKLTDYLVHKIEAN